MYLYKTCELCGSSDIACGGERTYRAPDGSGMRESVRVRLAFLFDQWLPERDEAVFRGLYCRRCGFSVYEPRPDAGEMDRKYRSNTGQNPDPQPLGNIGSGGEKDTDIRSSSFFDTVSRHVPIRQGSEVLDFGGTDGSLMSAFSKHGCRCFVVDYHPTSVPGVQRLGSTLDDLPADRKFDGIICSHVFEHVPDVLRSAKNLAARLRPGGWMYVEVPMEIWRRLLPHDEPVTHINFFTPASLRNLLAIVGLEVKHADIAAASYIGGSQLLTVKGVAVQPTPPSDGGHPTLVPADMDLWLKPTWRSWFKVVRNHPTMWKYEILRLIRPGLH